MTPLCCSRLSLITSPESCEGCIQGARIHPIVHISRLWHLLLVNKCSIYYYYYIILLALWWSSSIVTATCTTSSLLSIIRGFAFCRYAGDLRIFYCCWYVNKIFTAMDYCCDIRRSFFSFTFCLALGLTNLINVVLLLYFVG